MKSTTFAPIGVAAVVLFTGVAAHADHNAGQNASSHMPAETAAATAAPAASEVHAAAAEAGCTISSNLTVGSTGDEVRCLQHALIEAGHLGLPSPTGYFGGITKKAVAAWQHSKGIADTGFFGQKSREAFGGAHAHEEAPAAHAHAPLDIAGWPSVPTVAITLHPDAMSGYNLEITTTNFRFAPEHVNGAVMQNEGHTHLYINGKKIGRVYGAWTHLPADLFTAGANEVLVTLNANDHSDLALGGAKIEAKATVTK